ncbi:MAG: nitroreductase family deazaflavin-dependent oxidoreductase [Chloroflexota bacterium]
MPEKSLTSKPPTALLRWFLRLPILIYRLRLGWLLGNRFLLINHIGRKSGHLRQTVVEVADHDQISDTYFVASGWGYKSNWYNNVMARPNIRIQVGPRKLAVRAESLGPEDGAQVLLKYRENHPSAANELAKLMGVAIATATFVELTKIVRNSLPIVAFRPQTVKNQQDRDAQQLR